MAIKKKQNKTVKKVKKSKNSKYLKEVFLEMGKQYEFFYSTPSISDSIIGTLINVSENFYLINQNNFLKDSIASIVIRKNQIYMISNSADNEDY